MNFMDSIKTCFAKYADFTGRASRSEYWWWVLANVIVSFVLGMIHPILQLVVMLGLFLPSLSAAARRMHDIGKSGWLLLLALIPLVGLVVIYFLAQPTQPEANQWGEPPKA